MEFRTLDANDIDCRIQSIIKSPKTGAVGAIVLLYKDARVDMRMLDEVVGAMNWKREHNLIGDRLYCTVSIYNSETGQWVGKTDVGTESMTEKEKGQASDSFKRACFNWGIGRELYSAPFTYIALQDGEWYEGKDGKPKSNAKFKVRNIAYDENRNIVNLIIVDGKGNIRFCLENQQQKKNKHSPQYVEFVKIAKEYKVPAVEITKYLASEYKKPKLDMLDDFELIAAVDWIKKYTTAKQS